MQLDRVINATSAMVKHTNFCINSPKGSVSPRNVPVLLARKKAVPAYSPHRNLNQVCSADVKMNRRTPYGTRPAKLTYATCHAIYSHIRSRVNLLVRACDDF